MINKNTIESFEGKGVNIPECQSMFELWVEIRIGRGKIDLNDQM